MVLSPKQKIIALMSQLGLTSAKAAEGMGITIATFNKKNSDKELRHNFNEANYQRLVKFVKKQYYEILTF